MCVKNRLKKVPRLISVLSLLFLFHLGAQAQKLDVAYVPTPDFVVERMLDLANVGPGDYLIDLGCGDGRINIAAAKRGAFGHGVDLDPERVKEARENAEKAGVADRVVFSQENIYDTDFSQATVIAMYLFPSINLKLRPKFLEELEPGTRIVSHDFGMDNWKPDKQIGRMENHAALLWIVPAKVEGNWSWNINGKEFKMNVNQKFQEVEIDLTSGSLTYNIEQISLSGKRISFTATDNSNQKRLLFNGNVENGIIEGIVQFHDGDKKTVENWSALLE